MNMPSGRSLSNYKLIAEYKGKKIRELGSKEPIQENDLLHWMVGPVSLDDIHNEDNAWMCVEKDSSLIGKTPSDFLLHNMGGMRKIVIRIE